MVVLENTHIIGLMNSRQLVVGSKKGPNSGTLRLLEVPDMGKQRLANALDLSCHDS